MRILAVIETPSWIEHHVVGALRDMGHHVRCFSYGPAVGEFYGRRRRQEQSRKNQALIECAEQEMSGRGLDLIFCYVYDDFLMAECARRLASLGAPMVNLNVDMTNQWYRQIRTARYFTLMLCAQRINMPSMALHGGRPYYFPMASRVVATEEPSGFVPAAPVTFVGTSTPYRARVLHALLRAGVPLAVYGKYWREALHATPDRNLEKTLSDLSHYALPRLRAEGISGLARSLAERLGVGDASELSDAPILPGGVLQGVVPDEAMTPLFRRSSVNLGVTRMIGEDPDKPGANQVKLRDFEVPGAGGFYLVEAAPDYPDLFEVGKEVETWRSPDELIDKTKFYLSNETSRRAIAAAGLRRTLSEHTWQHRFAGLFAVLGLK